MQEKPMKVSQFKKWVMFSPLALSVVTLVWSSAASASSWGWISFGASSAPT